MRDLECVCGLYSKKGLYVGVAEIFGMDMLSDEYAFLNRKTEHDFVFDPSQRLVSFFFTSFLVLCLRVELNINN